VPDQNATTGAVVEADKAGGKGARTPSQYVGAVGGGVGCEGEGFLMWGAPIPNGNGEEKIFSPNLQKKKWEEKNSNSSRSCPRTQTG